jgi:hypothetical protein
MRSLYLPKDGSQQPIAFKPGLANGQARFDEAWLQGLLFSHPYLIPISEIDPGASRVIPVCCELALGGIGSSVRLDIFGITPFGRPVLIECKMWRNPEARRKVVAQILEYAALLRRSSYGDLETLLRGQLQWKRGNSLYEHVKRLGVEIGETQFVDAVTQCLKRGDFDLIVAGDGIRSDLHSIAEHLESRNMLSRLTLVELKLWSDESGNHFVVPSISVQTQPIRFRVLVSQDGQVATVEEDSDSGSDSSTSPSSSASPDVVSKKARNKVFWQKFIDTVQFSHPDQLPPRHGINNYVHIPLRLPIKWLTAFRAEPPPTRRIGLFIRPDTVQGDWLARELSKRRREIKKKTGLDLEVGSTNVVATSYPIDWANPSTEDEQLAWLRKNADAFVNVIRPMLGARNA